MPKTIHLDGTTLEGGGQLLRIAIGLSALTGQPLEITDIRGNRSGGGGLKLQHLTGVQWLSRASGAATQGAEKKSRTLTFHAKDHDQASLKVVKGGWGKMETIIDIGSPGAIGLVFQAILPYILFAGSAHEADEGLQITIKGGTNVSNSPSIDYIQHVLVPMFERIGLPKIEVRCRSRGWSTGRTEIGAVTFTILPLAKGSSLQAFQLVDRGDITKIEAFTLGPRNSDKHVHRELNKALEAVELSEVPLDVNFELSGHEKRFYLLLVVHTSTSLRLGRDHLFQERFSSLDYAVQKLVQRAVDDLKLELDHGGCVDEYMLDQLAVYQALASGESVIQHGNMETSLHARTAHWVAKELLGVNLDDSGGSGGIGWIVGEKWQRRRSMKDDLLSQIEQLDIQDEE